MGKMDFKKEFKELYNPSAKEPSLIVVPPMNFLMADGEGDPNTSPDFQPIVEALYGLSYTLKFKLKKSDPEKDWTVAPLEGLWWADDPKSFLEGEKGLWKWTLMIAQPDYVNEEDAAQAMQELERKKNPAALSKVRFERYQEGLSVQIMHIGPYSAEGPTIQKLHAYMEENNYDFNGKHHEIYLGDPRKADPEMLKTVLRQPVRSKA